MAKLRTQLRQKEEDVEEVNQVASRLSKERDRVTDIVRQEFADRSVLTTTRMHQQLVWLINPVLLLLSPPSIFPPPIAHPLPDRLISTEEENRQVKIDMSELRARHKAELERVARGKERELEEVHERVKQALAKKEDNLRSLRAQHEVSTRAEPSCWAREGGGHLYHSCRLP